MKFIHAVLLFSGARAGRPNSHGKLFSTDLHFDEEAPKAKCFPQNTQIDGDWTRQCITHDECCSGRISKSAERSSGEVRYIFVCGCIPSGQPIGDSGDSSHCCSGVAQTKDPKLCGCLSPNTGPQANESMRLLPLSRTDCCHRSGVVQDKGEAARQGVSAGYDAKPFLKCGPGPCSSPGTTPEKDGKCCGGEEPKIEIKAEGATGKACGCIPAGTVVRPELEKVDGSMCCSGSYSSSEATTKTCGCIPGGQQLPGLGAEKTDCCNKALADDLYCQLDECILPHQQRTAHGASCCTDPGFTGSGKAPDELLDKGENSPVTKVHGGKFCGCIKGGTPIHASRAEWCCSRTVHEGKCTWLSFQEKINTNYMKESECFSGKANDKGECLCMKPDSPLRGDLRPDLKGECCSGRLNVAKRCSCITSRGNLRDGSDKEDCCTGLLDESETTCRCGPINLPVTDTRKALGMIPKRDCCSTEERDGFCACVKPGGKPADRGHCCAGHNKTGCDCLRAGALVVAGNSAEDVCCSKKSKEVEDERATDCKVKVCDK